MTWKMMAKTMLCMTMLICLFGVFPALRVSAERQQVSLRELIPQPTPTPLSTDRIYVVPKDELQQRLSSPQGIMTPSEREGASALNVTLEAEPVQSVIEGGIVLTVSIKNTSQQEIIIHNPLERISIQLTERFYPNLSLPRVLTRHEINTLDNPDQLRVPYTIREVRLNERSFSQADMNAYNVRIGSQEILEMTIEIDRLHDRTVKPQQIFQTPPGEYELRITVTLNESKERVLHQFEINPLNFDESKLAIRLEGDKLSPAKQQRVIEVILAQTEDAERSEEMMKQLAYHPTEDMLPVFLDVLNSERSVGVKRPALQGLSRVKGGTGIELYRRYASDPLLSAPLRSDAILLIGDFGNREDRSLLRQLEQEQNDGLNIAIFRAEEKLNKRFPSK